MKIIIRPGNGPSETHYYPLRFLPRVTYTHQWQTTVFPLACFCSFLLLAVVVVVVVTTVDQRTYTASGGSGPGE